MLRFLEGMLCGVLLAAVGWGPVQATAIRGAELVNQLIHCFPSQGV